MAKTTVSFSTANDGSLEFIDDKDLIKEKVKMDVPNTKYLTQDFNENPLSQMNPHLIQRKTLSTSDTQISNCAVELKYSNIDLAEEITEEMPLNFTKHFQQINIDKKILANSNPLKSSFMRSNKLIHFSFCISMYAVCSWLTWVLLTKVLQLSEFCLGCLSTVLIYCFLSILQSFVRGLYEITKMEHKCTLEQNLNNNENLMSSERNENSKVQTGWLLEACDYNPLKPVHKRLVYVELYENQLTVLEFTNVKRKISKFKRYTPNYKYEYNKNDDDIDLHQMKILNKRCYILTERSKILLKPIGLARKRYFSKKYPIILNCIQKISLGESLIMKHNVSRDFKDFGQSLINLKLENIRKIEQDEILCNNKDINLILFARCDRDKENWFNGFKTVLNCSKKLTVLETEETNDIGLNISSSAFFSNPNDFMQIMMRYQKNALEQYLMQIPRVLKSKNNRRIEGIQLQTEDKSSGIVWPNVLLGRVMFNILNDKTLIEKFRLFLEKKIRAIKLPNFMEDIRISEIDMGQEPPIVHKFSTPLLNEQGLWMESEISYVGLIQLTINTQLNLMRLKNSAESEIKLNFNKSHISDDLLRVLSDSDEESIADSDDTQFSGNEDVLETTSYVSSNGNDQSPEGSGKFLRFVDKLTASNLFQTATDISYIQKAIENINPKITLKMEIKKIYGNILLNLPPPHSDRIWVCFRSPPVIDLRAIPMVGSRQIDWSLITQTIEQKLFDGVTKYIVYPSMIDIILPVIEDSVVNNREY